MMALRVIAVLSISVSFSACSFEALDSPHSEIAIGESYFAIVVQVTENKATMTSDDGVASVQFGSASDLQALRDALGDFSSSRGNAVYDVVIHELSLSDFLATLTEEELEDLRQAAADAGVPLDNSLDSIDDLMALVELLLPYVQGEKSDTFSHDGVTTDSNMRGN